MSEDEKMREILSSMGVEKMDDKVLAALKECANSFAGDVLCDAKDYATHRGQTEIDAADVKLALKLTQSMNVAVTPLEQQINSTKDMINRIPLSKLVCQDTYGARYPKERFYTKPNVGSPPGNTGQSVGATTGTQAGATQERGELIPDPATGLLQRRNTLVPGKFAFPAPATRQRDGSTTKVQPAQAEGSIEETVFQVTMAAPEGEREAMEVSKM